ncbi:hypothetical protein Tco_0842105 [Tanacetum coccineum]|uniref:Uncharacterized protein n=1 Tax=Tanacetum coccineum TaxID=301880 RepID=A0ABQ5AZL9_9ASTR
MSNCSLALSVTNQEKQPSFQSPKDSKEPHLSDISGHLEKALAITPVDPAHPFELPPSGNTVIDFVNELGKDFWHDKPRHPVLQILWGIALKLCDHRKAIVEVVLLNGGSNIFSHKASHKASLKDPKKKVTPLLIPYGRVIPSDIRTTWKSITNIHRRPDYCCSTYW